MNYLGNDDTEKKIPVKITGKFTAWITVEQEPGDEDLASAVYRWNKYDAPGWMHIDTVETVKVEEDPIAEDMDELVGLIAQMWKPGEEFTHDELVRRLTSMTGNGSEDLLDGGEENDKDRG